MATAPWWTLPYQAYTYQGPKNKLPGILGRIHEAIDPVKAMGGYGGVLGAVMMGPGLEQWPEQQTAFTNPSGARITRLLKDQLKSGHAPALRFTIDPDGTMVVGDAYNFTHPNLSSNATVMGSIDGYPETGFRYRAFQRGAGELKIPALEKAGISYDAVASSINGHVL